jgi:hypothetical protein
MPKLPAFLAPEIYPYRSVEIIPASAAPVTSRLLADFITLTRAHAAALAADAAIVASRDEAIDDEAYGSRCGSACGYCGRCS